MTAPWLIGSLLLGVLFVAGCIVAPAYPVVVGRPYYHNPHHYHGHYHGHPRHGFHGHGGHRW
jgi:hypothetical protein